MKKNKTVMTVNGIPCTPISNSKFMNLAAHEGVVSKSSYIGYPDYEETTSLYRDGIWIAERTMMVLKFPNSPNFDCECYLVNYEGNTK